MSSRSNAERDFERPVTIVRHEIDVINRNNSDKRTPLNTSTQRPYYIILRVYALICRSRIMRDFFIFTRNVYDVLRRAGPVFRHSHYALNICFLLHFFFFFCALYVLLYALIIAITIAITYSHCIAFGTRFCRHRLTLRTFEVTP